MIPIVRMYHDHANVWISLESTLFAADARGILHLVISSGPDQETAVRNARTYALALLSAIEHAESEDWRHE